MNRNIGMIFGVALMAAPSFASGVLSIGQANGSAGGIVVVPVYAQISSDGALGHGKGQALQAIAFKVRFQPTDAVASVEVQRAGATKTGQPLFESSPRTAGSISYLVSFDEENSPLAITPGERVLIAELRVRSRFKSSREGARWPTKLARSKKPLNEER